MNTPLSNKNLPRSVIKMICNCNLKCCCIRNCYRRNAVLERAQVASRVLCWLPPNLRPETFCKGAGESLSASETLGVWDVELLGHDFIEC